MIDSQEDSMGIFDNLFDKLFSTKICTLRFKFDSNFETNSTVSVDEDGKRDEGHLAWVWVLYYAKILYVLGSNPVSNGLKNDLEKWAEPLVVNELSLIIFREEMNLFLDGELKLTSTPVTIGHDEYLLEVFRKQGDKNDWPYIRTFQSSGEYQNRLAYTVIVLGQYFINKNKRFVSEMALAVLSMRKYYKENLPFTDIKSTIKAPAFAIEEYIKISDEKNKIFDEFFKEWEDI